MNILVIGCDQVGASQMCIRDRYRVQPYDGHQRSAADAPHLNLYKKKCAVIGGQRIFFVQNRSSGRQTSCFGTFAQEKSLIRLSGVRGAGSGCRP